MRTGSHGPTVLDQHHAVGHGDGRRAMGNDDRRLACPGTGESPHHLQLPGRVHRRRGVVQDEDPWVSQQGPGHGDALALPAGQTEAPFAHRRAVAQWQLVYELVRLGQMCRCPQLFVGGRGAPDPQVGGDGVVEQEAVLEHDSHRLTQHGQAEPANVHPVEGHRPRLWVVETGQERQHGSLARTSGPHHCDHLSPCYRQVEAVEHRAPPLFCSRSHKCAGDRHGDGPCDRVARRRSGPAVKEADPVEADRPRPGRQRFGLGRLLHRAGPGDDAVQAVPRDHRPLHHDDVGAYGLERPRQRGKVRVVGHQHPDAQAMVDHQVAPEPVDGGQLHHRDRVECREVTRPGPHHPHGFRPDRAGRAGHAGLHHRLGPEALDRPHPRDGLLHHAGERAPLAL